jgi:hypothetical protein
MKLGRLLIAIIIVAIAFSSAITAFAEESGLIKGKLMSVDKVNKTIVVQEKDGKDITIYIEDSSIFSRIERLKIEIGEKVSVRYIIKNGKKIGTYIRSLRGC